MTTRPKTHATCLLALAIAVLFIVVTDWLRISHVEQVSAINAENLKADSSTLTGYAGNKRWLIVPEHDNPTYQWIQETEVMAKSGGWRIHRINYENAPKGREVHSASIYRWILLAVAELRHVISNETLGVALEHSALYTNAILHLLLVLTAAWAAWRFAHPLSGAFAAILLAVTFPLASHFLPGIANDYGLVQACTFFQAFCLFLGITRETHRARWFSAAGILGGVALWISAANEVPVVAALGIGGIAAAGAREKAAKKAPAISMTVPWRAWGLAGALTSLLGYLVEYFPHAFALRLQINSPLYALGWLGLAEIAHQTTQSVAEHRLGPKRVFWLSLGAILVAAVPISMWTLKSGLAHELLAHRLSDFSSTPLTESFSSLLARPGAGLAALATAAIFGPLAIACWMGFSRTALPAVRRLAILSLVAILCVAAVSVFQLRSWSMVDALAIALLVALLPAAFRPREQAALVRAAWAGVAAIVFFGLVEVIGSLSLGHSDRPNLAEIEGLRERQLAHWLADHSTSAASNVLLPPYRTASFCFYAPLHGIGSQNWENSEGAAAAFHLAASPRADEAEALVAERGVTDIVLPSWDNDLVDVISAGSPQPEKTFIYQLKHWTVYNWLRPRAYQPRSIAGADDAPATVFSVVDEADRAVAISRYTEYFLETQQGGLAAQGAKALRHYPGSIAALTTIAQVDKAEGDDQSFAKDLHTIVGLLQADPDQDIAFDQRVSLAVVLLLGGEQSLAQKQSLRCMQDATPERIRFLGTGALYHLMVLAKSFDQSFTDPKLNQVARDLLPQNLTERL